MNAGLSRTNVARLPNSLASDIASRVHMRMMHLGRQGLGEDVGHILGRFDLADLDAPIDARRTRAPSSRADRRDSSAGRNTCPSTA
eukprot:6213348-Pleurochrysis_carterae.AAC.3